MTNVDDILYSPIGEPETETQSVEPVNIEDDANAAAPLNWQMPTSQLQQNLSHNYRQLNQQPIHNFNQQAAQNQTLAGLTLEMVISDWWINTSLPNEE